MLHRILNTLKHSSIYSTGNTATKLIGAGLYFLRLISANWSTVFDTLSRILLMVSFPFVLYLFNFYEEVELERIKSIYLKIKRSIRK